MKIVAKSQYLLRIEVCIIMTVIISTFGCSQSPSAEAKDISSGTRKTQGIYIQPGYGTQMVHLGMNERELLEILGKPNDEYNHGNPIDVGNGETLQASCIYSEMHWFPKALPDGTMEESGDGIFAYLKNDFVFELSFAGKSYHTLEEVTLWTSLKDLKNKFGGPFFLLHPSANTATNDGDLLYLVEKQNGIAFELAAGYRTKERAVSSIYVFAPSSDFAPMGCVDNHQDFREISAESIR